MVRSRYLLALAVILFGVTFAKATIFGTVRGIVHDAQHRPIQAATVALKADNSEFTLTQQSDAEGAFTFTAVPLGNYTLTVTIQGFDQQKQAVEVRSDTSPEIHFLMEVSGVSEKVVVSGAPVDVLSTSITPTTTLSRQDIQDTPGADRTNSMAAITDNVPGAYMIHDMLHIRGGHQFSWLIDGVPVPNTNIATNVGPQIDPKDLDYLEVQRAAATIPNTATALMAFSTLSRAPASSATTSAKSPAASATTTRPTIRLIAARTPSASPITAASTSIRQISAWKLRCRKSSTTVPMASVDSAR